MSTVSTRGKLLMALIAAMMAAVVALGFATVPTEAYADFAIGTKASKVKAKAKYKKAKCKIKGTWKLKNSSDSYEKYVIKNHKKHGIKDKISFYKSGTVIEKDNIGTNFVKKYKYKWVAKNNHYGYLLKDGYMVGKINTNGKKLVIRINGFKRIYVR